MNRTIIVPHLEQPIRLDKFLVQELGSGWSRASIQRAIEQGEIKVNDKKVVVHHFLKQNEEITIGSITSSLNQASTTPNAKVKFTVIEETPEFIVVDKPTGLVVHPAMGLKEPTLVDGLLARYPEIKSVGEDPLRPGIVHRLDREVSGCMVVARTQAMYENLKQQFQLRIVEKEYTALVIGRPQQPSGTITFPLARSNRKNGKIAARAQKDEDTRDAVTHYTVERVFQQVTLLKVILETGRTHQIRVHLSALGYPIVGDNLYRPKNITFKNTPGRIFLHSTSLSFNNLAGERKIFTSPLPPELEKFLNQLS